MAWTRAENKKECIAYTVLQRKMEGTRRRGKPRTNCVSAADERSKMSLHQASEKAQDRSKWKKLETIVGAHVRLTRFKPPKPGMLMHQ